MVLEEITNAIAESLFGLIVTAISNFVKGIFDLIVNTAISILNEKGLALVLVLIISFISYKIVHKITKMAFKVISFVIVLIIVYFILTTFGVI